MFLDFQSFQFSHLTFSQTLSQPFKMRERASTPNAESEPFSVLIIQIKTLPAQYTLNSVKNTPVFSSS